MRAHSLTEEDMVVAARSRVASKQLLTLRCTHPISQKFAHIVGSALPPFNAFITLRTSSKKIYYLKSVCEEPRRPSLILWPTPITSLRRIFNLREVVPTKIRSAALIAEREKYRIKPRRGPRRHAATVRHDRLRYLDALLTGSLNTSPTRGATSTTRGPLLAI